ncbi:MAG: RloB family protein [Candidatus Cryptobacteroides sp.]
MRAKYNPRKEHSIRKRYGFKNPKKSFLIICEGENMEPDYFNAFRLTSATVKAVGKGLGTMSLVREAISFAEENGFNVAYSNQSFELWFILHFNLLVNPIERSKYVKQLSKYLGIPYTKQSGFAKRMYEMLKPLENKAIENAHILIDRHIELKPSEANPSTTVHKLVCSLNKFLD